MCAYRLFGRRRVCPDLDMPGEREDLASTTPVHGPGIKMGFCRILPSKGRDTHRPGGCQVVGAEAERRKARPRSKFGKAGCRVADAILSLLDAYHHRLPLFSAEPRDFCASFSRYEANLCTISISPTKPWCKAKETTY